MKIYGYIRVSTKDQDLEKQRHLILQHAMDNKKVVDQFLEVEISSRKSLRDRRIEELLEILQKDDILIVAELSRLGRSMMETLQVITEIQKKGVDIEFIRQPELSTNGPMKNLILAIYAYFAESEREFISMRTKQGLDAARANGKILGRPKGSIGASKLDKHKMQIEAWLEKGINLTSICKLCECSNATLYNWAKSRGIDLKKYKKDASKTNAAETKRLVNISE